MPVLDLVIRGATVVDGTGAPARQADVGVEAGRISVVGQAPASARLVLDATGWVLAPGFIDAHTHDDLALLRPGGMHPKVSQGVTSVVVGNCGFSALSPAPCPEYLQLAEPIWGPAPAGFVGEDLRQYRQRLEDAGPPVHAAALVGHGTLRACAVGLDNRPATPQELDRMVAFLDQALADGAVGLSLGLQYVPGMFASKEELETLARAVARRGGVVAVHMRGEGAGLQAAVDEMLKLAEASGAAVHLSHLKVTGRTRWGTMDRILERIDQARSRGLDITADVYPYEAGSTAATTLLPPWSMEGGVDALLRRLGDPADRERIVEDLSREREGYENHAVSVGWHGIVLADIQSDDFAPYVGDNFRDIAAARGQQPAEAFLDAIQGSQGRMTVLVFHMDMWDVDAAVRAPFTLIGSDGLPVPGRTHPRAYGTFPRVLRRYALTPGGGLSLEEAVAKMTGRTAARFGLAGRGRIAPGCAADLVLLDPKRVEDRASYRHPHEPADGITAVLVDGRLAYGTLPGVPPARGGLLLRDTGILGGGRL